MDKHNGYSATYPIDMRARSPIVLDEPALRAALAARLGRVNTARGAEKKSGPWLYFLEDYPVEFANGSVPAQLALFTAELQDPQAASLEQVLHQSRSFPGARGVFNECRYSLMLTNMMSSPLAHGVRRKIIVNGLLAVLERMAADLIFWRPTQQMLSPADVCGRYSEPKELANPVFGFLNVRFFNISNSDSDMVMDTLGLNALGLTDFQIHYRELEPDPVARLLYGLGAYAFEKGDVIEDGHTVEGLDGGRWKCRRETSLVEPHREVLDINPGPRFAAGDRQM
jgi:hypothetical protein